MEENKTKQELLTELQKVVDDGVRAKETIELMLNKVDKLGREYYQVEDKMEIFSHAVGLQESIDSMMGKLESLHKKYEELINKIKNA